MAVATVGMAVACFVGHRQQNTRDICVSLERSDFRQGRKRVEIPRFFKLKRGRHNIWNGIFFNKIKIVLVSIPGLSSQCQA
jgi:hypothetical protein